MLHISFSKLLNNIKTSPYFLYYYTAIMSVLVILGIDVGHEWGDDFALYISQAKAMLNADTQKIIEDNTWMMKNSVGLIGPEYYPWGYPVFLSVCIKLGLNPMFSLKVFQWIVFSSLGTIILLSYFEKLQIKSKWLQLFLISIGIFHPKIVLFANRLNSDLLFLLLIYGFFLIIEYSKELISNRHRLLLGLLTFTIVFCSSFIRDVGLFLLIPWFITSIIIYINLKSGYNLILDIFLILTIFYIYLINNILNSSHNAHVVELSVKHFRMNSIQYLKLIGVYIFIHLKNIPYIWTLFWLTAILFIYKGFNKLKIEFKLIHFPWVFLNVFILMLWPSIQGERFLFPWIFSVFLSLAIICNKLRFRIFTIAITVLVLLQSLLSVGYHFVINSSEINGDTEIELFDYIKRNTKTTDIVYFSKCRLMYLKTQRLSLCTKDDNFIGLVQKKSNIIVINKKPIQGSKQKLAGIIRCVLVYENRDYQIYRNLDFSLNVL